MRDTSDFRRRGLARRITSCWLSEKSGGNRGSSIDGTRPTGTCPGDEVRWQLRASAAIGRSRDAAFGWITKPARSSQGPSANLATRNLFLALPLFHLSSAHHSRKDLTSSDKSPFSLLSIPSTTTLHSPKNLWAPSKWSTAMSYRRRRSSWACVRSSSINRATRFHC